jgi:hypothetical protein
MCSAFVYLLLLWEEDQIWEQAVLCLLEGERRAVKLLELSSC